jgi:cytosine/adenosine deaminase-related metal-dependent hydrolase/5-hydroxyisourate hydrolase-like protein (transthyretin family)
VWAADADAEYAALAGSQSSRLGCSTVFDHHYVFPREVSGLIEAEVQAARELGVRIVASRGSMDHGVSDGGLPPDELVESIDAILSDTERLAGDLHESGPGARVQIVAPCSPFSFPALMTESAALARRLGLVLHTHLAETLEEEAYCMELYGCTPVEYLTDLGWLGDDVWCAHCVHLSADDVADFASSNTGVAHCPTSNLRLGAGVAPVRQYLDEGIRVGLGVDGSASNERSDLLFEVKQALLVARGRGGPAAMTAREALRLATRGSAAVLGRSDIGSLEPGKCADLAVWRTDTLELGGAEDPVAGLVLSAPHRVDRLVVGGEDIVRGGALVRADEAEIARDHRVQARRFPRASTHILDTEHGEPGAGIKVGLFRQGPHLASGNRWRRSHRRPLRGPLPVRGVSLVFYAGSGFFEKVEVTIAVPDPDDHIHVPLLLAVLCVIYRGS